MDFYDFFYQNIFKCVENLAQKHGITIDENSAKFVVESPKNENFGDISTNVAMALNKVFKLNPLDLANIIVDEIKNYQSLNKYILDISVAKPAFINIKINNNFWQENLLLAMKLGSDYGRINLGRNKKINIEYVSANPTGPMHIGHGRGATIGDVLASLYKFLGYDVITEYYVNDSGGQIIVLGNSLYCRYLEQLNLDSTMYKGDNFYPGEYLIPLAKQLVKEHNDKFVNKHNNETIEYFSNYAIEKILVMIKEDLSLINVKQDYFCSERSIATDYNYNEALDILSKKGLIYMGELEVPKGKKSADFEVREQKLFKSTIFGDDSDRALEKSNGVRTYFANDLIYHYDKIKRGAEKLINIWGADHIGYISRMKSVVKGLSDEKVELEVVCTQLVNLLENDIPLKMSKRAGTFVTLKEVVEAVGVDVFRFMMITRKNDVSIDFDLKKVKEQSNDNPVFYIQYAYARICSVLRNAKEVFEDLNTKDFLNANLTKLNTEYEINLVKNILKLEFSLKGALHNNDPHRLYLYLNEIAKSFHSLWNKGKEDENLRFIMKENKDLTYARLALLDTTRLLIANILNILKINIKETM
jgi:arginyl-tRNA synthetase